MGGIETDIDGATRIPGIWAAGEAACVSLHGANRLGTNSTAECLVWGGICGERIAARLEEGMPLRPLDEEHVRAEEERIFGDVMARDGPENPYAIRTELRQVMDRHLGVFRSREGIEEGIAKLQALKARFRDIRVEDKGRVFNANLVNVLETENLLELAEVSLVSALPREESRGAHARTDFPGRDDENWLKHTLAIRAEGGVEISYKPVAITHWKPVERKY
jgi:succinate dehydrogenase / fumarate reductase flavoprotein subunit